MLSVDKLQKIWYGTMGPGGDRLRRRSQRPERSCRQICNMISEKHPPPQGSRMSDCWWSYMEKDEWQLLDRWG